MPIPVPLKIVGIYLYYTYLLQCNLLNGWLISTFDPPELVIKELIVITVNKKMIVTWLVSALHNLILEQRRQSIVPRKKYEAFM